MSQSIIASVFGFLPNLNPLEMVIIGVVAVLLFGNRLPEVGRSIGKGIIEFKKGLRGIEDQINAATSDRPARSTNAAYRANSYRDVDDRDDTTAPKFEPPPAESPSEQV